MLKLKPRGDVWYAVGKIKGTLYRVSTGIPVGTRAQREAAERRASELDLEIRNGNFGWRDTVPTIGAWWKTYEKSYLPQKAASSQERDTSTMVLHALPFFGETTSLGAIKKTDCVRYLNTRRGEPLLGLTRKTPGATAEGTVQRERALLQAIWEQAINDGHDLKNPWKGIERKAYAVKDRVVTAAEQLKLLAKLSPKFQRFVIFLACTGVRLAECRGIDPARHLSLTQRFVIVTGKGSKTRHVPLSEDLIPIIEQQMAAEGCLWPQGTHRLYEVIVYAARAAKIPHVTPHTLRHTFGHRWLTGGGDIYALSRILGHSSVKVTETHYAHLLKTDLRDKLDAVDMGIAASVKALVQSIEKPAATGRSSQSVIPFSVKRSIVRT